MNDGNPVPPIAFSIAPAADSDVASIAALGSRLSIENFGDPNAGFLVSGYDESVYRKAMVHGAMEGVRPHAGVFVARSSIDELLGFVFGYNASYGRAFMGGKTEAVVDRWLGGSPNYYILKQIATDPRQRKLGIGESLAHHFLTLAPPPLDVFLTIVVKPANPASERFHRRLGFTPVIDATSIGAHGETFPSRIWRRVPAGA